jgi:hypothetical protein
MASDEWARAVRPPIHSALKPLGFRGKRRTWHRPVDRLTTVVQLEASRWGGDSGRLAVGYWLESIGAGGGRPPLHRCHVILGSTELFDDPWDSVDAALDFGFSRLAIEQRPEHIARSMAAVVVPFLGSTQTMEGLAKSLVERGLLDKIFVDARARVSLEARG